jgi:hypothetical protein
MEDTRLKYEVKERRLINGDRYFVVYLQGKLIIILKNRQLALEYLELNKK